MTSLRHAQLRSAGVIDSLEDATTSPGVIVVGNSSIRWEVTGQIPPGTSIPIEIENGVENFPPGVFVGAPQRFGTREEWFNQLPLSIAQVRCVCFSRHFTNSLTNGKGK